MLKNVTFLRHYQLEYPYDNWRNQSLNQYKSLTEGKTDPRVKTDISSYIEKNLSRKDFTDYEIILTSELLRTKQTAEAINKYFPLGLSVESNPIFNEITSAFTRDLSEEEYLQMRKGEKVKDYKKRVLNKDQKIDKLKNIEIFLKRRKESKILVISHSYLIAQLNYFYNIIHRDLEKYFKQDADGYEISGYIKGFSVEIEC